MKKLYVALVFPSPERVGRVNLGFNKVFQTINSHPSFVCDRFFYENSSLINIDSRKSLDQYHIVAFSISFFNDFIHIPFILKSLKTPPLAIERKENFPFIIGGGNALTLNPEPVAEIFDAIVIGEAEPVINFLLKALSTLTHRRKNKILEILNENPHIYIPVSKKNVKIAISTLKHSPAVSRHGEPDFAFGEAGVVEIGRGCRWKCRFCPIGYAYLPPRFYSKKEILKTAEEITEKKIGLIAPVVSDHPDICVIAKELQESGKEITTSSWRIESSVDGIIPITKSFQKTITIAPETGSEKLKRKINKTYSQKMLFKLIDSLPPWVKNLRCYIMIGFPEETLGDIKDTVEMLGEIKRKLHRKRIKLFTHLNPFVPLPHTPFQWYSIEDKKSLENKIKFIRKECSKMKVSLKVKSLKESIIEAIIARGDRTLLAEILTHKVKLRKANVKEPFPWDFIISPAKKEALREEFTRAESFVSSPPCPLNCEKCATVLCAKRKQE